MVKLNFQAENFQLTWATAKIYESSARGFLPQLSVIGHVLQAHIPELVQGLSSLPFPSLQEWGESFPLHFSIAK